ncbi:MAG: GTP 3',8-cyclase MoaA [bacterium]
MLIDNYHRQIDYLRLSITDMCNLRCLYCRPFEEIGKKSHFEVLRYEEIVRIASLMVRLGVKKIRITGGEPLIKRDVNHLIEKLFRIEGLEDLALTTNGTLLAQSAPLLKQAGLKRVNISLDSLDEQRYTLITGGGNLKAVLSGIDAALRANLKPVKVNMVVMNGINADEVEDFAWLTLDRALEVRFIEFMPIGRQDKLEWQREYLPNWVVKERLARYFHLVPAKVEAGNGPAEYYQIKGACGKLGFISSISDHFCQRCNRLRLTPDGHLRVCLGQTTEFDLKGPLREGASDNELTQIIIQAIKSKPISGNFNLKGNRQMVAIGG